jgi:two-component system, cell cycle sensor histidine kinase and response regulator CckA
MSNWRALVSAGEGRAAALASARLELVRTRLEGEEALSAALARTTRIAAEALNVERVGVWMLVRGSDELTCIHQFVRTGERHERGEHLRCAEIPSYCRALEEERVLAADDVRAHPATAELGRYLDEHEIGSMLDAPVFRNGDIIGIVCHEHVGEPRQWTESEQAFASSMADMVAHVFDTAARLRCERALHQEDVALLENERSNALRLFAGGVAHDINNVLTAASLAVAQLKHGARSQADQEAVDTIAQSLRHGATLARQLLDYSSPRLPARGELDVRELLSRLEPVLRGAIGAGVTLRVTPPPAPVHVRMDHDELARVILNLVRNASEATAARGEVALSVVSSPDWVSLIVSDEGTGMTPEVSAQIFEPYFTTKSGGVGRGLGLSTVSSIVASAGGTIDVESALGRGSRFVLRLPRTAGSPAA